MNKSTSESYPFFSTTLPLILTLNKYQTSNLLQTESIHFLDNIPYCFALYFLKRISAQFKIYGTIYSIFTLIYKDWKWSNETDSIQLCTYF